MKVLLSRPFYLSSLFHKMYNIIPIILYVNMAMAYTQEGGDHMSEEEGKVNWIGRTIEIPGRVAQISDLPTLIKIRKTCPERSRMDSTKLRRSVSHGHTEAPVWNIVLPGRSSAGVQASACPIRTESAMYLSPGHLSRHS